MLPFYRDAGPAELSLTELIPMVMSRAIRVAISSVGLTAAAAGVMPALAGTPALVVDVASGRVLRAERATDPWYPASVTKLMTTYVALEMVRNGEASMDQLLTLSAAAAAQPPSKMGFKPGTQITLDNALKIIMVKSANDLAMSIGENLGGSVEGFAAKMNDAARRLGMRESHWYNSNGLPDERQFTSARDLAILARALLRDFPEHEGLFHIGAVQLGRNIMRNHNGMLGRYPGADGMKTGFICAGGFNIVSTATQNGRRILTVVLGYPSARERDLRAADLLDEGFASSTVSWGGQKLEDLPPSSALAPPDMRPIVCGPHKRQPEDDDEPAVVQAGGTGGNAEGGIAALFSPSSFAFPSGSNEPQLGRRRTLGPRVAFTPIPVFLGAAPGSVPDDGNAATGKPIRMATKPVKTKPLSRNAAAGAALPNAAQAFTGAKVDVDVVKAQPRAGGRAAISANLDPTPSADSKPKPGQLGGGARRSNLGGIASRQPEPIMASETPAAETKAAGKPAGKAAAKAATAKADKTAAAKPARKPAPKPAKAAPADAAETE
jgi:D-alanyl-D-alanine carboxypeptidase